MKTLNNKSGILAAKSIGLGLILLLVFVVELTTWTIENVVIPSSIKIAETIVFSIKELNELNKWCDAQIEPKSKQVLAIELIEIAGLLMPATERILVTNPVLPSRNEVIEISPRCSQISVKPTIETNTVPLGKAINEPTEVSVIQPKRGRGKPKKSVECTQTNLKLTIEKNTVPPDKAINEPMEVSTIEPKRGRGRQKKSL